MAERDAYRFLQVARDSSGFVATVILNRPEVLNALNTAMGEELVACFRALAGDEPLRAVVLTGVGERAFCTGADLKERDGMTDEAWRRQHAIFEAAFDGVRLCPVPVIAAVEGYAMGGGCELALNADFIVASETALFALPEVTRGIFPGGGGTQLLPRAVGKPLAKELIFTGRRFSAPEAREACLVNHLVPAGQARARAEAIAGEIGQNGPVAVRQAKKAIDWGAEVDLETGLVLSLEAYNVCIPTEDRQEGIRAFNERRPPRFQGR